MSEKQPQLPTLTKKELKNLYNVSETTLRKWIKSVQHLLTMKKVDKTIPPHDLQIIIDNYGVPEKLEII